MFIVVCRCRTRARTTTLFHCSWNIGATWLCISQIHSVPHWNVHTSNSHYLRCLVSFCEQHRFFCERSVIYCRKMPQQMQLHNRNTSVALRRTRANEIHLHPNAERIFRHHQVYRYFHQCDGKRTDNLLIDTWRKKKRSPHASHVCNDRMATKLNWMATRTTTKER